MLQSVRRNQYIFVIIILFLIGFLSIINTNHSSPVLAQENITLDCEQAKTAGDYNCDGIVSMSDFEDMRRVFVAGQRFMRYFEYWRRAFFAKRNPIITPTPTVFFPSPTSRPTQAPTRAPSPTPTTNPPTATPRQPTTREIIQSVLNNISEAEIRRVSTAISSRDNTSADNRQTRFSTSNGYMEELQFLKRELASMGLATDEQPFAANTTRFGVINSKNLIAKYAGSNSESNLIVSAHLDSVGSLYYSQTGRSDPQDPYNSASSPAPGADDDGSGVVATYAIARAIATVRPVLNKSILFLFYGGEEEGLHGSRYFAARSNPTSVYGVYQMDMIGYGPRNDCVKFIYRPGNNEEKRLTDLLISANNDFAINLQTAAAAKIIPYSDHASFHQYAINATLGADCALIDNINTVSTRSYYHDNLDTTANLNYSQIAKTAKIVAAAVISLASQ